MQIRFNTLLSYRCLLKDRKLERVGFGEIFLETELIYNPLRAAIKTLLPAEENLLYEEPKFKRNLFMQVGVITIRPYF